MKVAPRPLLVATLAAGGLLLLCCQREHKVSFDLHCDLAGASPGGEVVVLADGVQVARTYGPTARLSVPGHPQQDFSAAMLPALTVRARYPCGWRELLVRLDNRWVSQFGTTAGTPRPQSAAPLSQLAPQWIADSEARHQPVEVHIVLGPAFQGDEVTLWVDNRGQPAAEIAVGEDRRPLPAGFKGDLRFGLDASCPRGREVRIRDAAIGTLPERIMRPEIGQEILTSDLRYSREFLVDVAGDRCYRSEEQCYARASSDYCRSSFGSFGLGEVASYRGRRFYRLTLDFRPDFFLEDFPKVLAGDTLTVEGGTWQRRIGEVACR